MILSIRHRILMPFLFITVFMTFSALFIAIELVQHYFDTIVQQETRAIKTNIDKSIQYQLQLRLVQNTLPSTPSTLNNIDLSYNTQQSKLILNTNHPSTPPPSISKETFINLVNPSSGTLYIKKNDAFIALSGNTAPINTQTFTHPYSEISIETETYYQQLFQHSIFKNIYIRTLIPNKDIKQQKKLMIYSIIIGLVLINMFIGVVYYFILKYITMSLSEITESAKQMAKGQLTSPVKIKSNDEIGLLAQSFNGMLNNVQTKTAELIYERNRSKMILAQLPEGIIVTDLEHRLLSANKTAETMLGFSSDCAKGQEIIQFLKNENLQSLFSDQIKTVNTITKDIMIPNDNGKKDYYRIIISPLLDSTYQKNGIITVIRDITHEKQIKVLRDSFLRTVTHELRTPLTSIIGFLDILSKQNYGNLNTKQMEFLDITQHNATYLKKLMSELIDLSSIYSGKETLQRSKIDINTLCPNIIKTHQATLNKKKNKVSLTIQTQDMSLFLDKEKLIKIVENLLLNANKFTNEGTIDLTINKTDTFSTFIIKDSGFGLSNKQKQALFQAFEKKGTNEYYTYDGLSLEMAIVKELVHLHNGQIYVESKENQGSTFTIIFPLTNTPVTTPA
jgi:PAS domain S-box-containing protein